MALAQELMGLGVPPQLASRIATAGAGPVTVAATGTGSVSAAKIYGTQYVVSVTGAGHVIMPSPSAATAPLISDSFVINNGTSDSVTVWPPAGVTVNIGGLAFGPTNPFTLVGLKTLQIWTGPTTTTWFGISA